MNIDLKLQVVVRKQYTFVKQHSNAFCFTTIQITPYLKKSQNQMML